MLRGPILIFCEYVPPHLAEDADLRVPVVVVVLDSLVSQLILLVHVQAVGGICSHHQLLILLLRHVWSHPAIQPTQHLLLLVLS